MIVGVSQRKWKIIVGTVESLEGGEVEDWKVGEKW
jgi:hypothetical protein